MKLPCMIYHHLKFYHWCTNQKLYTTIFIWSASWQRHEFTASVDQGGKYCTCQEFVIVIFESYIRVFDTELEVNTIIIDGSSLANSLLPWSQSLERKSVVLLKTTNVCHCHCAREWFCVWFLPLEIFFKGRYKKQRKNENIELGCLRAKSLKGAELLRDNNNKTELTNFFCHRIYSSFTPNTVILTKQNNIASIY